MVKIINFKNRVNNKGVAILFAILLVSVVLTVGLTLLNITYRQLVLSSLAQESQFAFYAADSARNCARHYDSIVDPVSGSSDARSFGYFYLNNGNLSYQVVSPTTPNCGLLVTNFTPPDANSSLPTGSFTVSFNSGSRLTCAEVKVYKDKDGLTPNPETGQILGAGKTMIIARGYNNSANGTPCYVQSDRTVERASTMIY